MLRILCLVLPLAVLTQGCAIDEDGDRIRFGISTTVAADETTRDVVCIFCSIRIDGTAEGDAVAVLGNITVNGDVEGDAVAAGGRMTVGPGAGIDGDAVAVGGLLIAAPTATFGGDVVNEGSFVHVPGQRAFHVRGGLLLLGASIAVTFIGGALFRRRRLLNLADCLRQHIVSTTLIGLLILIVTSVGYSLIGGGFLESWLDLALLTAYSLAGLAGHTAIAVALGRLPRADAPMPVVLLTGSVAIAALYFIPVVGLFIALLPVVVGIGVVVMSGLGSRPDWFRSRFRADDTHEAASS